MDLQTLQKRQQWTLDQKIYHSLEVIDNFIARMDKVLCYDYWYSI